MIPRDCIRGILLLNLFTFSILTQSTQSAPSISPILIPSLTTATPSEQTPSIPTTPTPTPFSLPTASSYERDSLLSPADCILDELHEYLHTDLRKRQGGVAATNVPQATSVITQMSPITTYGPDRGWPLVIYSQKFSAVPDQWSNPVAGTIGLGTIQGQVGVVKSISKRSAAPAPTGQIIRIRGREVVVS